MADIFENFPRNDTTPHWSNEEERICRGRDTRQILVAVFSGFNACLLEFSYRRLSLFRTMSHFSPHHATFDTLTSLHQWGKHSFDFYCLPSSISRLLKALSSVISSSYQRYRCVGRLFNFSYFYHFHLFPYSISPFHATTFISLSVSLLFNFIQSLPFQRSAFSAYFP